MFYDVECAFWNCRWDDDFGLLVEIADCCFSVDLLDGSDVQRRAAVSLPCVLSVNTHVFEFIVLLAQRFWCRTGAHECVVLVASCASVLATDTCLSASVGLGRIFVTTCVFIDYAPFVTEAGEDCGLIFASISVIEQCLMTSNGSRVDYTRKKTKTEELLSDLLDRCAFVGGVVLRTVALRGTDLGSLSCSERCLGKSSAACVCM